MADTADTGQSGPFGTGTPGDRNSPGAAPAAGGGGSQPAGMPGFGALQGGSGDPGGGDEGPVIPGDPSGYQFALAYDFEAPEGFDFEFADDHPTIGPIVQEFRQTAHEIGLNQEQFSRIATLAAKRDLAEFQAMQAASKEQLKALGPNAASRVDAVTRFLSAHVGEDHAKSLVGVLFTKTQVEAFEKLMGQFKSRGVPAPSLAGREGKATGVDGWSAMSAAQKLAHAMGYGRDR